MYPEPMIAPMRAELTGNGFNEFRTAESLEDHLTENKGTTMIVVN
jgi:putative YphP/YqiW family bacilliredoxin